MAEGGVTIRVRQRPLVAVERAAIGAACVAVTAWTGPGWPSAAGLLVVAAFLALVVLEPAFVADADGLSFSRWSWPWRRRRIRWDQAHAVRLVPGSFERPGRRIEVRTSDGWLAVGSPRDGWVVHDQRLEGLVDELWRRIPPRPAPEQP